jgi:NTP pyrophosphatase (non-canonical NTP hydrolase)
MNIERINEALNLLQEESAELIVEISKCRRFGFNAHHYQSGKQHKEHLQQEIADVLVLIDILVQERLIDDDTLTVLKNNKQEKLKKWSTLFSKQETIDTKYLDH